MRKSKNVATLLAGGALLSLGLTGCDPAQEEVQIYPGPQACAEERPAAECEAAFGEAQRQHLTTAPRFTSKEECEAEMGSGACTVVESGQGSVFMPLMAGFLLGRMLSGPNPVYVDRRGFAHAPGGTLGRLPGGRTTLNGPVRTSAPRSVVSGTSRGGFGSTGRSFSAGS